VGQDTNREKALRFATDCASALGADLRAVLVQCDTGIRTDSVSTVMIVSRITTPLLRQVAGVTQRRKGVALPLLLDDEYLATSCDVFPLEILTLMDSCELLWGGSNPLDGLAIDHDHLRLEVEQQLKGKVLHLRQAFLAEASDKRGLQILMLDSSSGFEAIMRGLLMLAGRERTAVAAVNTREVERALGISLETFRTIQAAREQGKPPPAADIEPLFHRYLSELTELARAADRITRP